jgi:hypothetical protein
MSWTEDEVRARGLDMDLVCEIGAELVRERKKDGFNSALRELCIKHGSDDDAELMSVAEQLTRPRPYGGTRVPDGWLIGKVPDGSWVVAVLEIDDTHSDIHKWEPLACAFDASSRATFLEFRRHRNGPLQVFAEGDLCMQRVGMEVPPTHVPLLPWSGVIARWHGRKKKTSVKDLIDHMHALDLESGLET